MKERTTEITIETYEVLIRGRNGVLSRSWCVWCGKHVAIISLNDARNSGVSIEAVHRQAEAGRIHLIETVGGPPLICLNSLIRI